MVLLYFVGRAGYGGHTRDALDVAAAMSSQHNADITFLFSPDSDVALLADSPFRAVELDLTRRGSLRELLSHISVESDGAVLHTWYPTDYSRVAAECRRAGVRAVASFPGGPGPIKPISPLLLLSARQIIATNAALASRLRWPLPAGFEPPVIAGRLDVTAVVKAQEHIDAAVVRSSYGVAQDELLILRVVRPAQHYVGGLLALARAVVLLRRAGVRATYLHIGHRHPSDRPTWSRIDREFALANEEAGEIVCRSAGILDSVEASALPVAADLVVGTGRAAVESVVAGCPTFVPGHGDRWLPVQDDTIDVLLRENFSERWTGALSGYRMAEFVDRVGTEFGSKGLSIAGRDRIVSAWDSQSATLSYKQVYEEAKVPRGGLHHLAYWLSIQVGRANAFLERYR